MGRMPCKVASPTEVNSQQPHSLHCTFESLNCSTSVVIFQEQKITSAVGEIPTVLETPRGMSVLLSPSVQAWKASPMLPSFSLTNLPKELQLLVLEHCFSSTNPIINAGKVRDVKLYLVASEKRGQEDISDSIIFLCKEYYQEHLRIFYSPNLFLYLPIMRLPQLTYRGDKDALCKTWHHFPTTFSKIKNLNFRILCALDFVFSSAAAAVSRWLENVPQIAGASGRFCKPRPRVSVLLRRRPRKHDHVVLRC